MNNFIRLSAVAIYPLIILFCFILIYLNNSYNKTIKNSYKIIILNSFVISIFIILALIFFFHFEDTIYVYDYAGHWIRSLKLREIFFLRPRDIYGEVFHSMNYDDYSMLPALFSLPGIILNTSYLFFNISSYLFFLLPSIVLLQILYFKYFENCFIPIFISIIIYPLWLTLFYGKVDCCGMFFIIMSLMTIIFRNYEEIKVIDSLLINLFGFLMIFLRRWYLYALVAIYLCYFIKYIVFYRKKIFAKDSLFSFLKFISSGLILLIIVLAFFRPFFINIVNNDYSEAYQFYNNDGKLISLVNNISPIVLIVSFYGLFKLFNKDKQLSILIVIMIIFPTILFWKTQSMEYHHYYIIIVPIIILFTFGIINLKHLKLDKLLITLGILGTFVIFTPIKNTMPLFTNIRKRVEIIPYKQDIIDLANQIKTLTTDAGEYMYLASGSYVLNDDILRNSLLPIIDNLNIDFATLDLRDGFPRDMKYIRYIAVIDPILYSNEEYQHIYTIISNAVVNNELVSSIYTPIIVKQIDDFTVTIYDRTGDYSDEIKKYFYSEVLKYYPDKREFFSYILD